MTRVAVGLADVLEHGHVSPERGGWRKSNSHDLALLRQLDLLDLVERLDAALHLRRLGGVGLKRSMKRCSLASIACWRA
jgi:hypothetical protein